MKRRIVTLPGWTWIFLLLLIFGVPPGYGGVPSQGITPAGPSATDDTISRLSQRLKEQQAEKKKLSKKIDSLAESILKEKQRSGRRSNWKLDVLLRESQRFVSDMESLSSRIAETESQLRQSYSAAITSLVKQLEEQSEGKKRKTLLKKLLTYLKESEKFEEPVEFEVPEVNLEVRDSDTPFEIRKKADFLSDRAALLKAKIFQIEEQIAKLEKEKALRDKVRKFADEMSFFDETLMVQERKMADHRESDPPSDDPGPRSDDPGPVLGISPEASILLSPPAGKEAFDSSPSDLLLSQRNIDEQVELLKEHKSQLANQIQHLLQKTQNFYQQAEELNSSGKP